MNRSTDWALALAWSLGHAILTALVGRTAVNASVTYDAIRLALTPPRAERWVGRCAKCRAGIRVDGVVAVGRRTGHDDQIVIAGTRCYRAAEHGSNPTVLFVACRCGEGVKLQRVFDNAKPNRPRHECSAKCLNSTGPACECKCKGANHGSGHRP